VQASSFIAQRVASKGVAWGERERLSIAGVRQVLQRAADADHAPAAAVFLQGLSGILDACIVVPGRATPSRKTTRRIFMHFAVYELPALVLSQQRLVRRLYGELLSHDGTFAFTSSLVGADYEAPNAVGKAKLKAYAAAARCALLSTP
jgi:hypothetical protein